MIVKLNVSEDEVISATKKGKPNVTSGPDCIPSFLIRNFCTVYSI